MVEKRVYFVSNVLVEGYEESGQVYTQPEVGEFNPETQFGSRKESTTESSNMVRVYLGGTVSTKKPANQL